MIRFISLQRRKGKNTRSRRISHSRKKLRLRNRKTSLPNSTEKAIRSRSMGNRRRLPCVQARKQQHLRNHGTLEPSRKWTSENSCAAFISFCHRRSAPDLSISVSKYLLTVWPSTIILRPNSPTACFFLLPEMCLDNGLCPSQSGASCIAHSALSDVDAFFFCATTRRKPFLSRFNPSADGRRPPPRRRGGEGWGQRAIPSRTTLYRHTKNEPLHTEYWEAQLTCS